MARNLRSYVRDRLFSNWVKSVRNRGRASEQLVAEKNIWPRGGALWYPWSNRFSPHTKKSDSIPCGMASQAGSFSYPDKAPLWPPWEWGRLWQWQRKEAPWKYKRNKVGQYKKPLWLLGKDCSSESRSILNPLYNMSQMDGLQIGNASNIQWLQRTGGTYCQ